MRPPLRTIGAITVCLVVGTCFAQGGDKTSSLCSLQENVAEGEHINVRVSGVLSVGPENSTLDDPWCPVTPYQSTWVEFDLQTKRNDKKLRKLLKHSRRVYLVSEGEFYGPPLPDPKLPKSLQKRFRPHWGHLGCCRTKLVIHVIREVKAVPGDHAKIKSSASAKTRGAGPPFPSSSNLGLPTPSARICLPAARQGGGWGFLSGERVATLYDRARPNRAQPELWLRPGNGG